MELRPVDDGYDGNIVTVNGHIDLMLPTHYFSMTVPFPIIGIVSLNLLNHFRGKQAPPMIDFTDCQKLPMLIDIKVGSCRSLNDLLSSAPLLENLDCHLTQFHTFPECSLNSLIVRGTNVCVDIRLVQSTSKLNKQIEQFGAENSPRYVRAGRIKRITGWIVECDYAEHVTAQFLIGTADVIKPISGLDQVEVFATRSELEEKLGESLWSYLGIPNPWPLPIKAARPRRAVC